MGKKMSQCIDTPGAKIKFNIKKTEEQELYIGNDGPKIP